MYAKIMKWMQENKILPQISATERQALEAGDVWIDGQFFAGKVDFDKILKENYATLSAEEQAFLDGPVEQLCQMVSSYELSRTRKLPDEVFKFMADNGFFAMQIAPEYGGKPMSILARSSIMAKVSSYSGLLSSLVVIPNSLGAAELLGHYGTPEQKNYYLPRLAKGEFIPCFALTEPTAGSDAASIKAEAVVFKDQDGTLKFKMNFRKRFITLAPIANLISLAVQVQDPQQLLGKGEHPGITVVLLERGLKGLHIGDHHQPIGEHFPNGPVVGRDVIVPVANTIGGAQQVGNGWRMLMEALAGGRMVSLPATGICGIKHSAIHMGAYSMVRRQFGIPIGRMEGVAANVAKAAAMTYAFDAARIFGCSAVDRGIQPPVISAIMKAYSTEMAGQVGRAGMDVVAGLGVIQGPNNSMGRLYNSLPVAVTVEGANIMTRTLLIFGQGATRCHPYAFKVVEAVENNDVSAFKQQLWRWLGQFASGLVRVPLLGISRGRLSRIPKHLDPATRTYYRRLNWAAARFGLLTNLAMFFVGGKLKQRGNLTGRYADVAAWLYILTATLRRFEAEGRKAEDLVLVHYTGQYALAQMQEAFVGIYDNFDGKLGAVLRLLSRTMLALNPLAKAPNDQLVLDTAKTIQSHNEQFLRLVDGNYLPQNPEEGLGRLLHAFKLTTEAEPVRRKIKEAQKNKKLPKGYEHELSAQALELGIIKQTEFDLLAEATSACLSAYEVDVFTPEEYYGNGGIQGMTATGDGGQPGATIREEKPKAKAASEKKAAEA